MFYAHNMWISVYLSLFFARSETVVLPIRIKLNVSCTNLFSIFLVLPIESFSSICNMAGSDYFSTRWIKKLENVLDLYSMVPLFELHCILLFTNLLKYAINIPNQREFRLDRNGENVSSNGFERYDRKSEGEHRDASLEFLLLLGFWAQLGWIVGSSIGYFGRLVI